jgi:hypothetical protein
MNLRLPASNFRLVFVAAIISPLAAGIIEFIVALTNVDFRTPGMVAVHRWNLNGPHLKLGDSFLITVGLDSFVCFLVILGLLALYKLCFARPK